MLEFRLTPNHAGIALWGDFCTLSRLHEFVHHVVEQSDYIEDKEGFVLGLAYDFRKAYQGERSEEYRGDFEDERYRIFGVEILWPVLLTQIGILRQAMAFIPTSKLDQAVMFELEYVVESAVRSAMPAAADEIIFRIKAIGNASYMHVDSILDSRISYFIRLSPQQRLTTLAKVLQTFDPMYGIMALSDAKFSPDVIPPTAFTNSGEDWPDFEW
ncbi:DUF6904 family protein [Rheinheimera baltica]|uniref:DUF6904 family protein n=1 Tax=Rheinheimera baltica TaxID=67576 RepID=UPI0003FBEA00|nr:hypothetical protein [Rheinheimera baltica]